MNNTIAAISTPHFPGAIGMIRISGESTLIVLTRLLKKNGHFLTSETILKSPREALFCDFIDNESKLDEVIAIYYPAPNSFTGEDVGEIFFHGNPILLNRALELIFINGSRPAENGEFTKRAFLNGKKDLSAAEAIHRVITARSRLELELAQKNAFGKLKEISSKIRSQLINLKAECEAEIDFSTEDLTYQSFEERKQLIRVIHNLVLEILEGSERAHTLINQSKIVLYGAPNTGKSSLLNSILGKERAIISDIPGTTRDYLSETIYLDGYPIQLVDTAGIRETEDTLEKQGISRSKKEIESADIKLLMLDTSHSQDLSGIKSTFSSFLENAIVIGNKIDIQHNSWKKTLEILKQEKNIDICELSCKTGEGIGELIQLLKEKLSQNKDTSEYVLLEERNKHHFREISQNLERTLELMETNTPPEIYIKEIDNALEEIGQIHGKVDTEEILGRIFSKFCVGK